MHKLNKISSLFLKNSTIGQTILKNSFWLTIGNLFLMVSKLSVSLLFTNKFGNYEFGIYSYILTITSFFQFFITYGIPTLIITELNKTKKTIDLKPIMMAKGILLFPLSLLLLTSQMFFPEKNILGLLTIYSLTLIAQSVIEVVYSIFRSQEKMEKEAFLKIFDAVTTFMLVIFGLSFSSTSKEIFVLLLIQSLMMLLMGYFYYRKSSFKIKKNKHSLYPKAKNIIKISFIFAVNDILVVLYQKVLLLITKAESSISNLGVFNGSYQLITYSLIAFNIISVSVIPSIIKHSADENKIKKIKKIYFSILVMVSASLFLFFFIVSFFISNLLGNGFEESGKILRILLLVYMFRPLYYYWGNMLTIEGKMKQRAITQFLVPTIGTPIFILIIERLGPTGSAISVVISEFMICFGYYLFYKKTNYKNQNFYKKFILNYKNK